MKFPHSSYRMENSRNLMTRVHALFACLILIAAPLSGCLSGDDLEELVDNIIGCMDENAENYDDNATSELVGDCIYMATMDTFMDAMSDVRSIEEMLEDTPKAGYSQSMNVNEWNDDLGMQMDVMIIETVMADLDNDAVHVYNFISIAPLMTMSYTHAQIGEVVNIHYTAGGMIAEGGESESYQTRDATPNVLEVLADQVGLFSGGEEGEGMLVETPDSDVDEIPEDAVITITMSDDMESQTMTMEYTEDGAEITMTIHINQNEDLMSFTMASDNGSATTNIEYQMMWGDAVVIEVDETLPKTSIPVWIDIEPWWDDDDDDTFHCDNGNEIPWDYVDDGWDDCGDGSDESEPEMACYNDFGAYLSESDESEDSCNSWTYLEDYSSPHSDEPFTGCYNTHTHVQMEGASEYECDSFYWTELTEDDDDDDDEQSPEEMMDYMDTDEDGHLSLQELFDYVNEEREQDGVPPMSEEDEEGTANWFYSGDTDGDNLLSLDEFTQLLESTGDDGDDGNGAPTPEEAMESVDANGDGYMSYQEFEDAWESDPENPELDSEEVAALFDDCDYDDNDLIDIDEMQCFVDGIGAMLGGFGDDDGGDENPEQMFDYMDTDDDGYLSLQDLIDYLNNEAEQNGEEPMSSEDEEGTANWFYSGDTDGDDLLSLDEFTQLVEESTGDDDGDDDTFYCDNGNEIPMEWVNDGDNDCGDWSDESDDENDIYWESYYGGYCEWEGDPDGDDTVWWCKESQDDEYWNTWWYYCEHHDSDWHCTDDFGQSGEFEHSADGDEWSGSDDDDDDEGDEMFTCDNGDEIPMDWVNDGEEDCEDGSDEFDDGGDDEQDEMPAVIIGYVAKNQTLNAPISDFETRFLSDCDGEYNEETGEMEEPDLNECTVEFSIPLTGGEANGVTHTYTDLDGDGLVSPGDMLTLEGYDGQTRLEMYDTWASEYTSDSLANPPALPGFGALMALTVLLGAAFATRRD